MALCHLRGTEALGLSHLPSISRWLLSYHSRIAELSLIEVAAAQVTDGFTLTGHWGSVIVVQLVLLGLSNEFAGQIKEKFLNIVRLFG